MAEGRDPFWAAKRRMALFKRKFGPDSPQVRWLMNRCGLSVSATMVSEMNASRDIHGNTFKPYSKAYVDYRVAKKIRSPEKVVLALSGKLQASINHVMLNNSTFEVGAGAGNIVKVHSELGRIHDQGYRVPKREWCGYGRAVMANLNRVADEGVKRLLNDSNG